MKISNALLSAALVLAAAGSASAAVVPLPFSAASQAIPPQQFGSVRIQVLDSESDRPLAGMMVEVSSNGHTPPVWAGETNEDGLFSIRRLPAGSYHAKVLYNATFAVQRLDIVGGEQTNVTFQVAALIDP